jgi:thiol-disulfide isomerase/thioredoxin
VRRALAAGAALLLALSVAACDDDREQARPAGGEVKAQSSVAVDTPELQELRRTTGMGDCRPGPGGGALPELTLPCLGGGTSVDLASLKGPMVLNFWASWCGPCAEEMPSLETFFQEHGQQVPVLGVDWQDTFPASALTQVEKRGVTYPSVADPGGETAQFAQFAKMPGMPMTFLIDADGEIAYQHAGGVDSADELADLVREHLGVAL